MTSISDENVAPFKPFEEYIEQSKALQILRNLTKGADDGEIYFERNSTEVLVFDNNNLKTAIVTNLTLEQLLYKMNCKCVF